jgi:hypothetical protein
MWLEIIENSRANESRSGGGGNRYGAQMPMKMPPQHRSGGGVAASSYGGNGGPQNYYHDNQDDESLDNYFDVQDADAVTLDKSYGAPNDDYFTGISLTFCFY